MYSSNVDLYHLYLTFKVCFGKFSEKSEACVVYENIDVVFFRFVIKAVTFLRLGKIGRNYLHPFFAYLVPKLCKCFVISARNNEPDASFCKLTGNFPSDPRACARNKCCHNFILSEFSLFAFPDKFFPFFGRISDRSLFSAANYRCLVQLRTFAKLVILCIVKKIFYAAVVL